MKNRIRVIALCAIFSGERVLLSAGRDALANENYYRPFGGGVEFDETAIDAVRRELAEELGQEITVDRLLGVLENRFSFEGEKGHEIVFVFAARFVDARLNVLHEILGVETERELKLVGHWLDLSAIEAGQHIVYPSGVAGLITNRFRAAE